MNIQDLQNLKKGCYHKASWKSTNGNYEKISVGVVRIVKYGNINGVEPKGKENINEKVIVSNMVYFNEKTGNTLVQLTRTNNPHHRTHTTYLFNGNEITRQEYEMENPPRKSSNSPIFRVKLENLIYIK